MQLPPTQLKVKKTFDGPIQGRQKEHMKGRSSYERI